MIGLFEPVCAPWRVEGIPADASFLSLPPDWDRMGPFVEAAMSRVPVAFEAGIRTFFCGPESFTPDLRPIVGPAPEVRGYCVAAGLNSIGILTGGGMGQLVARWIIDGDPGADVTGMHPARLQPYQANPDYRRTRTVESLGLVYACHYPNRPSPRPGTPNARPSTTGWRRRGLVPRRERVGVARLVRRGRAPPIPGP